MAKSVQEQLIEIAPILQVLFALGSGLGLIVGSLPEAEFESALGLDAKLYGLDQQTLSYDTYGGFARFVPTLFTAVLRGPLQFFSFFVLLLIAGGVFLIARGSTTGATSGFRKRSEEGPSWPSDKLGWILGTSLVVLAASEVASYPWFEAPRHLKDLAIKVEKWPETGFFSGRVQYQRLYSAFFGVPLHHDTFPPPPDFSIEDTSRASVRHEPSQEDFEYLFSYYNLLAVWTICTLVALVTVTLWASVQNPKKSRWVVSAAIVAVTFAHLLQWTGLAYAYGRLYLPAVVVQRTGNKIALAQAKTPDNQWPFRRPAVLTFVDKERLNIDSNILALSNYWWVRPDRDGDPVLAVSCRGAREEKPERPIYRNEVTFDYRPGLTEFVTVFGGLELESLIKLCSEGETIIDVYDGYGRVFTTSKSALERDVEAARNKPTP
jgi:hypothetical protein